VTTFDLDFTFGIPYHRFVFSRPFSKERKKNTHGVILVLKKEHFGTFFLRKRRLGKARVVPVLTGTTPPPFLLSKCLILLGIWTKKRGKFVIYWY
jgi:hypothetical protein